MAKPKTNTPISLESYLISDLDRVARQFEKQNKGMKASDVSRDYYRSQGRFRECTYTEVFASFATFKKRWVDSKGKIRDLVPTETVVKQEFISLMNLFGEDFPERSVEQMSKNYYMSSAKYDQFLEDYYDSYEEAREDLVLSAFGPARKDIHIAKSMKNRKDNFTLVLTAALPRAAVYEPGVQSVQTFLGHVPNSEFHVLPMRGIHHKHTRYAESIIALSENWATELDICSNLEAKDLQISPMSKDPISGIRRLVEYKSLIVAHPKQRAKGLPVENTDKPKTVWCTGVITVSKYARTGSGYLGERDAVLGGLIVEVEGKTGRFWVRQFQFAEDGSFYHKDKKYSPNGKITQVKPGDVHLTVADLHCGHIPDWARNGTFKLIKDTKIKRASGGDWFDGYSISHHHERSIRTQANRREDINTLRKELDAVCDELTKWRNALGKDFLIDIIRSNHDEHLDRWLDEGKFVFDRFNVKLGNELFGHFLENKNPMQYYVESRCPNLRKNINWMKRGDQTRISGKNIAIGCHGDEGPNGAKGSTMNLELAYHEGNFGHVHTPEIYLGVYRPGVMAPGLEYAKNKPSSWQVVHVLTYPDGMRTLVWISFDGKNGIDY